MKELNLIIVEEKDELGKVGYTAYLNELRNVVVQTDTIEDIPKKLSISLKVLLKYLIKNREYKLYKYNVGEMFNEG